MQSRFPTKLHRNCGSSLFKIAHNLAPYFKGCAQRFCRRCFALIHRSRNFTSGLRTEIRKRRPLGNGVTVRSATWHLAPLAPAPQPMSAGGRVSRASPVQTAVRNCTRDEGRSFEIGSQVLVSNHCKLLSSKAMVVSVAANVGTNPSG